MHVWALGFELWVGAFQFGVLGSVRALSVGRRRRWVAIFFPRSAHVAAGPLNPPTLGRRRAGASTGDGIGCTIEKKLHGRRGLGLVGCLEMAAEVFDWWFYGG